MTKREYLLNESLRHMQKFKSWLRPRYIDDGVGTWDAALTKSTGYGKPEILDKVITSTQSVISGFAEYERDSKVFYEPESNWQFLCALLLASRLERNRNVNILDFGGSLGSTYFQHSRYLTYLENFNWDIVEQPSYVESGLKYISSDKLFFHNDLKSYLSKKEPSLAYFGSSLQYIENYEEVLTDIDSSSAKVLLFDRTPFIKLSKNLVAIQQVPKNIYKASYPINLFSLDLFKKRLMTNWQILNVFDSIGERTTTKNGISVEWTGIICVRKNLDN